ncbi:MAG: ABC transporter permease, partial [Rhodospirillaceae bacterium]|nr:ABC transporter permease [Rhodospirillaceae bacterium]
MGRAFFEIFVKRLALVVPMLVFVSALVFVTLRLLPADPIAMLLPPNATAADVERLRALYGLDRPLYEQYFIWLSSAFQGNFGFSIHLRESVLTLVAKALPATLELVTLGLLLGTALGVGGGVLMFAARGRSGEFASELVGTIMLSIPEFLWAIFLLLTLGVAFDILPFV